MSSRARGKSIAHEAGSQTTVPGNNVADTAATASLTTGSVDTSGRIMDSESKAAHSWSWADIPASNTRATRSVQLIRGRNTGE